MEFPRCDTCRTGLSADRWMALKSCLLQTKWACDWSIILVGGLEHFFFFHILGIIIPTDFHIFQRDWNHQPDNKYPGFGVEGQMNTRCSGNWLSYCRNFWTDLKHLEALSSKSWIPPLDNVLQASQTTQLGDISWYFLPQVQLMGSAGHLLEIWLWWGQRSDICHVPRVALWTPDGFA